MKNFLLGIIAAVLIALLTLSAKAQGPTAATSEGSGPHTTCTTPAVGHYYLCQAIDGIWVSNSGGAYFQLVPPSVVIGGVTSVAINGVTKTGAASFTLTTPTTVSTQ